MKVAAETNETEDTENTEGVDEAEVKVKVGAEADEIEVKEDAEETEEAEEAADAEEVQDAEEAEDNVGDEGTKLSITRMASRRMEAVILKSWGGSLGNREITEK